MFTRRPETPADPAVIVASLFRQHYGQIVTVVNGRVSDLHEAEDIAATVFTLALAHLREGEEVTTAWLYSCARNLVGTEYQRRERASRPFLHLVTDTVVAPVDDAIARADLLNRAISTLALLEQDLVRLFYWHDMSTADIARMVGLSNAAVKMRLSRARSTIQTHVAPAGEVTA